MFLTVLINLMFLAVLINVMITTVCAIDVNNVNVIINQLTKFIMFMPSLSWY